MTQTKEITLQEQIAELQAQIAFLLDNRAKSPARRLQDIRSECMRKHFGTWDDLKSGVADYGAAGKNYSDYTTVQEIIRKTTDMLYRYSIGKANHGSAVSALIVSEEGMKNYKRICDEVCGDLRLSIDKIATH